MNNRRAQIMIAVVFLCVGILATWNAWRLNTYIAETLPRDQAQEQCNSEVIKVLHNWVDERIKRDASLDARDAAAAVVLEREVAGQDPTPEELKAWRDAVVADGEIRRDATLNHLALPECSYEFVG